MSKKPPTEVSRKRLRVLVALDLRAVDDLQILMTQLQQGNPHNLELAGMSKEGPLVYSDAAEMGADVVLLSPEIAGYTPDLIQQLYHYEERPILTVGIVPPKGDWPATMEKAGAIGHLNMPLTERSVAQLATMLPGAVAEAYSHRTSDKYIPRVSAEVAQIIDRGGWRRQTVGMWSPAGGVGKTTLAVNMAAALGVVANKRTLLIDADMNKGDVHLLFDLQPAEHNIFTLAKGFESFKKLSASDVKNNALPYGKSNLSVVCGIPQTWMAGEAAFAGDDGSQGAEFMKRLLEVCEPQYDFIVCDLGQTYNHPVHLSVLQRADLIFLVINSTVTSINAAKNALMTLAKTDLLETDRLRLVVNKFHPRHGVGRREIQDTLGGIPIFGLIPVDEGQDVVISLNEGEPLVLSNRKSPVSQEILQLASQLYPGLLDIEKALGGKKGSLLDRFLKG